jgi:hypothetical protein
MFVGVMAVAFLSEHLSNYYECGLHIEIRVLIEKGPIY